MYMYVCAEWHGVVRVSGCGGTHNKGGVGCFVLTVEVIHQTPIFYKKIGQLYYITNPHFVKLDNHKNKHTIMLMESNKNPLPKIDLFPRCTRVFHFIFDHLQDAGLSDHNTGGGPALDRMLYDQVQVHGFLYEGEELDYGTLPQ